MYYHVEQLYYEREKELIAQEGFFSDIKNRIKDLIDKFIKWWKNWFAEIRKKLERLKIRFGHRKFQKEHPEYKFSKNGLKIKPDYKLSSQFILDMDELTNNMSDIIEIYDFPSEKISYISNKTRERFMSNIIRLNKNFSTFMTVEKRYKSYSKEFSDDYNYIMESLAKHFIANTYIDDLKKIDRKIWDLYNGELTNRDNNMESNFSDEEFSILKEKCGFLVEYCEYFNKFIYNVNKALEEFHDEEK